MSDANEITVAFDELSAVRIRDGLRLKPEFMEQSWGMTCHGCEACSRPTGYCDITIANSSKHCHHSRRKDGKHVRWVPA